MIAAITATIAVADCDEKERLARLP